MIAPARARSALGVSQIRSGMCQIRSGHREHQKHIYSCSSLVNDPAPGERKQGSYASSCILNSETCASPSSCVQAKERNTESRGPGSAAGAASPGSLPGAPERPPGVRVPGASPETLFCMTQERKRREKAKFFFRNFGYLFLLSPLDALPR